MSDIDLKEELPGQLQLKENADYEAWPDMGMEIHSIKWQGAEPDVGIMSAYPEDYSVSAWVGDAKFENDFPAFAAAVHAAITNDVEESAEDIVSMLESRCENALLDEEPDDGNYED